MKWSQQSDGIERIVLPGHNMMATANLACPNRAFSQCAVFLYFLSITIIFFFFISPCTPHGLFLLPHLVTSFSKPEPLRN